MSKIQAKDIPDEAFLAAIDASLTRWPGQRWAMAGDVSDHLGFPHKVVLAKARSLMRRGIIGGCACGCRGDFHYPPEW